MKYNEFEKHIKSELGKSTMNVDVDKLINNIHPLQKNRGKLIYFLISFLVLSMTVLTAGMYIGNKNQTPKSKIELLDPNESRIIENQTSADKNEMATVLIDNPKKEIFTDKKIENKRKLNNITIIKKILEKDRNKNNSLNNIVKKSIEGKGKNVGINNNITSNTNIENSISKVESIQNNKFGNAKIGLNKIQTKTYDIEYPGSILSLKNDVKCFDFKTGSGWKWIVGADIALMKPFERFSQVSGDSNELFEIRDKHEKPLEGIGGSVFTEVRKNNFPLYFRLGVSYTRIANQLKLKITNTRIDTSFGIISITESENGDTLTIIKGEIYKEVVTERNIKSHYYFHHIDIPIGLGYDFNFGSFLFTLEAGAIFNIKTTTSGIIMDKPNHLTNVNDTNQFKTSIGLSYYGAANLIKPITYNTALFLRAKYRYIPGSYTNSNSIFKQNYNLASVHIGVMIAL